MAKLRWIRWWAYSSFRNFMLSAFISTILCVLCMLIIPSSWCLFGILPICCIGGYFMRKEIPNLLRDLIKEMSDDRI